MSLFIDSHTHLDDLAFDEDRDQIIKNFKDDGVLFAVNASSDLKSSYSSVELTKHENIYAVVGVHPHEAKNFKEEDIKEYKKLSLIHI